MFRLDQKDYKKVLPILISSVELSVFSVIYGTMPGEIYVNNILMPRAALIKTSECNMLAGCNDDADFNSSISDELDFWDPVTPDSESWYSTIPLIHKNRFVRSYTRRYYTLKYTNKINRKFNLPEGYSIEPVIPSLIRESNYENSEKIVNWVDNWGNDKLFYEHGVGYYIRNEKTIVSWSLSDCYYGDRIAIGIHTDERFRKMGFGINVVSETINTCFKRGYNGIEWLCVDVNKGSIAIAEKLGFELRQKYNAFTPYPPIENINDLSGVEWNEWGLYFEKASSSEPNLLTECLFSYIKADNIMKANEIIANFNIEVAVKYNVNGFIHYLHTIGMGTNFPDNWMKEN